MTTVGAFEAKTHFSRLLERVEHGEEITITRRGEPIAKLVPVAGMHDPEAVMATFRRMQERAREQGVGSFDWDEWEPLVDEGRP